MEVLLRGALGAGAFLTVGSLLMLAATDSGTPEHTITLVSLVGGLAALVGAVAALSVRLRRLRAGGRADGAPGADDTDRRAAQGDRAPQGDHRGGHRPGTHREV